MSFKEIREQKGLKPTFVNEKLKELYGIELTDWQFYDRENHPKKYLPKEIQALCDFYEVGIQDVEF